MVRRSALFLLKTLTWRGALAMLDVATHPIYTLPIGFIALVKPRCMPSFQDALQAVTQRVVGRLVRSSAQGGRGSIRDGGLGGAGPGVGAPSATMWRGLLAG